MGSGPKEDRGVACPQPVWPMPPDLEDFCPRPGPAAANAAGRVFCAAAILVDPLIEPLAICWGLSGVYRVQSEKPASCCVRQI